MEITGTIYGSTSNQYVDAKVEWSYIQNADANTSTVTATLYYKSNTGYIIHGDGGFTITIDGIVTGASPSMYISTSWVKAISATEIIPHNDDGTKTITIKAAGSVAGTTLRSTSCSGTITLQPIPRASTILIASRVMLLSGGIPPPGNKRTELRYCVVSIIHIV